MCPCGAASLVKSPQLMKRTDRMHACRIKSHGSSVFGGSGDECTYSCLQQYPTKSIFCGVEQHKHEWEKQPMESATEHMKCSAGAVFLFARSVVFLPSGSFTSGPIFSCYLFAGCLNHSSSCLSDLS